MLLVFSDCMAFLCFFFFFQTSFYVQNGWGPLHAAASKNFEKVVKILIEHGSNMHLQNKVFIFSLFFLFYFFSFFILL